jgi:porin
MIDMRNSLIDQCGKSFLVALALVFATTLHAHTDYPPPEDISQSPTLTGEWNGVRKQFREAGITIEITQIADFMLNTGGNEQGGYFDGLLFPDINVDLSRLIGWRGASFNVSAYVIQGEGITTPSGLGGYLSPTNIEYTPAVTKLAELWLQQEWFDNRLALKVGQIEGDTNFNILSSADFFINGSWGWLGSWSANLPGSGPTYPNPVPAVQLILRPVPQWTIQAAVFNGSPTGNDPEGNANGLRFPIGQGALSFLEFTYEPDGGQEDTLPHAYKLGAWYHSGDFDSYTTSVTGEPRDANEDDPQPKTLRGNYALYLSLDRPLWYESDTRTRGLNLFGTLTINPQSDRNVAHWLVDAGLAYTGLIPGRPLDRTGIGITWLNMSPDYAAFIQAIDRPEEPDFAIPSHEAFLELTHQAVVNSWLKIQPFFQYVVNPGQHDFPPRSYPDMALVGIRLVLSL